MRETGDFSDAAGEREMAPECGSLLRDAGDLVGLMRGNSCLQQTSSKANGVVVSCCVVSCRSAVVPHLSHTVV